MKTLQKGFIVPLLLILIALILVGGGIYVYMQNKQVGTVTTDLTTQPTSTVPNPLSKLARDLATVTPQFVDNSDGRQYPDYIMDIRKDLGMVPIFRKALDNSANEKEILLKAIGKRYVLLHMPGGKDGGRDVVFDSETQQITDEINWPLLLFKTDEFAVYVLPSDVCIYTLDQSECVSPPGAKLDSTSGELYWDPMGGPLEISETHTDNSLIIGVFDRNTVKRLRDVTFVLP